MRRSAQMLAVAYLLLAVGLVGWQVVQALQPPPPPVTISIVYGTEKRDWLEAAAALFEQSGQTVDGRAIEIDLQGMGSGAQVSAVLQGDIQPTVVSPASSLYVELLYGDWLTRHDGANILLADSPAEVPPLVLTPLVLVGWEQRANALWSENPTASEFWDTLHAALTDPRGWETYGHPEWGFVKFGHTRPSASNSGLQTIVLLAYAYHNKTSGLGNADILDRDFQEWLVAIELAVPEFGDSTGTFMNDMVLFGPSKYDFVVVYENLAVENFEAAEGRWEPIRVYYPPANIWSDHPYAILNAEWVTDDQRAAALLFQEFLLSEEIQRLALLDYGFRPVNLAVPVATDDPANPFNRYQSYGIQQDIPQIVEVPPAETLTELLELWRRNVAR